MSQNVCPAPRIDLTELFNQVTRQFDDMGAIEFDEVTKQFGSVTALSNLSLTINEGEIFGFLGPNGAGKSTTINLLLDFVRPTSGTVTALGHDAHTETVAVRRQTGVLPEGFDVYDRLSGQAHIEFAIESKDGNETPAEVLDRVGLSDAADRLAGGYSKGMKQRLALGMALVGDPDLLVLDEPATGLDPSGAHDMRRIVLDEAASGTTVFFSSHVLEQVEAVCYRVGILRGGELVAVDSIDGLRAATETGTTLSVSVESSPPEVALESVRSLDGVSSVTQVDNRTLTINCTSSAKTTVLSELDECSLTIADFETEETSLEDLFLQYTNDTSNSTDSAEAPA